MTVEEIDAYDSLELPSLTVCSDQAYKTGGFHFNQVGNQVRYLVRVGH